MIILAFFEKYCLSFIMIFLGIITFIVYPKKPNYWIGFRTEYALSSPEAWRKAQITFSKNVFIGGVVSLMITCLISIILSHFGVKEKIIENVILLTSLFFLVFSVFHTDRRLRKNALFGGKCKAEKN